MVAAGGGGGGFGGELNQKDPYRLKLHLDKPQKRPQVDLHSGLLADKKERFQCRKNKKMKQKK